MPCSLAVERGLPEIDEQSDDAYWHSVERVAARLTAEAAGPSGAEFLADVSAHHPEWPVRAAAVRLLADEHGDSAVAGAAVAAAIHDEVDWVAFTAIELAGRLRLRAVVPHLINVSGWPSNFTRPGVAREPVGSGAAFAKRALLAIFGSYDPEVLRRLEDEHFADLAAGVAARRRRRDHDDVVLVPAGPFIAGAKPAASAFQIGDTDSPRRVVDLPAFLIDRTAVTNQRYRWFLDDTKGTSEFDHPDQEPGRGHEPAHRHDPRFNRPDLPVVGIDWYDAWAFARWAGGDLPSEDQWEKAARGSEGRVFPWGDEWDRAGANSVETAFGVEVKNLQDLELLLVSVSPEQPPRPVVPADHYPAGTSPYGALQMAGNVWEMTRTNFYSRQDLDPFFRGRRPVEFMNRKDAFPVLRGGAWTSPPVCLTASYRGKGLLTDRHNEVGFRCVYPVEEP